MKLKWAYCCRTSTLYAEVFSVPKKDREALAKNCMLQLFFLLALPLNCFAEHTAQIPSATNVLQRMMERATQVARGEKAEKYCYTKKSVTQELNSRGETIKSTEKQYEVVLIRGWPFSRLVQVQGQKLSEAEIRNEDQREQEFREKVAGRDLKQRRDKKEAWITPELLGRYHFAVISNDVCGDRKAVILEFKPKPNNPEETVEDRIINRFAGRLWLDDEDAEIARLDVHLTGELSLGWLGMIGSLKECNLTLQRKRMPEGTWVNTRQTLRIIGRKLFSTMRYRAIEESTDFRTAR